MMDISSFYIPDWGLPKNVHSLITKRGGGASLPPYDSFNLAAHVDDNPVTVNANREALEKHVGRPISWLTQVHGTDLASFPAQIGGAICADGCWTEQKHVVCSVSTADCLPLLMCDRSGKQISAVHAGWRGLASGMVRRALALFNCPSDDVLVYIGPAISQAHFQVGKDVYDAFSGLWQNHGYGPVDEYFAPDLSSEGKYFADLYALAEAELRALGVKQITRSLYCTWENNDQFYSYRKEGLTGRFASLIWIGD